MERLQKYMARCGVASRRRSEEYISLGRVKVNGVVITQMGYKVSNDDVVTFDGKQLFIQENKYYVMNKPRFIISTSDDEKGRKTIISILPEELQKYRLFSVGRLDYDTKGVLLLTNDGEFANNLVGPDSHIEKEYIVRVKGIVTKEELRKLALGVTLKDGYVTRKCKTYLSSIDYENQSCSIGIILQEGKYHQVKNMVSAIGHPAKRLTRIRFGCITLDGLAEGEVRQLTPHEIKVLLNDAKFDHEQVPKKVRIYS